MPIAAAFLVASPVHWLRCVLAEWQLVRARLVRSRLGIWLLLLGAGGAWLAARGASLTVLAPQIAMLGAVLGVAFTVGSDADRAAIALTLTRSEEHTSELQSPCNLVCRLLLEKKKNRRAHYDPLPSRPI